MNGHVIITGAASGIGWALAQVYWQQGYHLHLIDRDGERLLARQQAYRERMEVYPLDLLDDGACDTFCQQFLARDLPLARLINNAGITHRSKASLTELTVFDRVMQLNWHVPVLLTQRLLPALQQAKGKVITLGSMASLMPVPGRAAYCASKAAVSQHFETWRPELRHLGIGLLMVYPSFVNTDIEQNALGQHGDGASHPRSTIGKAITADDMAAAIYRADQQNVRRWLSPVLSPRVGLWLWRIFPRLFERLSWQRFRGEWS
ncbi:SDR family NAD(P)-dependent oxidoreductase [Aestuariibacter halophilus]|uniref:SDR family NAD(P)-dependent oxidoreductase n=1 Tax=Fluctibacter halophilus TaxID=226011 RepID=A0ABS8G7R8_9ALTE|nr:SDR family NAD(P)-dependent oxidoreductase [Aestuariibacter halophilus]MCC2616181.1 SDR family NAD(P)-dependent oxidoreductase [Aestuariibacter halophilus]